MRPSAEKSDKKMKLTLKTFFGLEEVLKEELIELGYSDVQILNRAVQVEGTWKDVYFLNLYCRCAIAVLAEIRTFNIREEDDLYKECLRIDWTEYFDKDKTFAVKGAIFSEFFKHSQFPFLRVKDAIADTFRKKYGVRPDVNVKSPQVVVDLYINNKQVVLSLNTSGLPLFQRGYRQSTGEAPINEVVAAALIRISGWDRRSTFIDPFCGSGTLLIEAALLATGIPSNVERQHYAFKNFRNFDQQVWDAICQTVPRRITELPCRIIGSDISDEMVTRTRRNLRGFSFGRFVETSVCPFEDVKHPGSNGVVITNPPYGHRIQGDMEDLYKRLGDWMKTEMKGYDCWIISSSEEGFRSLGLKPDKKLKLFNGELECSYRRYSIYEGSKKQKSNEPE